MTVPRAELRQLRDSRQREALDRFAESAFKAIRGASGDGLRPPDKIGRES